MLGIIGAMVPEVAALTQAMTDPEVTRRAGMMFYRGTIDGKECVVVQSGIGKVNAAMCAQILADLFPVTAIVNTGVAGSLDASLNIGDAVVASDAVQHDMDTSHFGDPIGQIPGMDVYAFPADERLAALALKAAEEAVPEMTVRRGRVVSGDQFISSSEKKAWLTEVFGASCTEMEGAAVAHAAYRNGLPWLVIRAISDKADDSAEMDYPSFLALASERQTRWTRQLIRLYEPAGREA